MLTTIPPTHLNTVVAPGPAVHSLPSSRHRLASSTSMHTATSCHRVQVFLCVRDGLGNSSWARHRLEEISTRECPGLEQDPGQIMTELQAQTAQTYGAQVGEMDLCVQYQSPVLSSQRGRKRSDCLPCLCESWWCFRGPKAGNGITPHPLSYMCQCRCICECILVVG